MSGVWEAWPRGMLLGGIDPFPLALVPMWEPQQVPGCHLPVVPPKACPCIFSAAERLTSVLPPRTIVRLRQEKISQSIYNWFQGQQWGWVWKMVRSVRPGPGTRGRQAPSVGREQGEGVLHVRAGVQAPLLHRRLPFLGSRLRTPGEKPSFRGIDS